MSEVGCFGRPGYSGVIQNQESTNPRKEFIMGTYAYYDGAVAGAALPHEARRHDIVLKKRMKTSAIIASDTTLTAAEKIAANDVIRAIRLPVGFVVLPSAIKIIVAEDSTLTLDVGTAADDYLFNGANLESAAGTIILTQVGDDWGPDSLTGFDVETADTLDCEYKNDSDTADYWLYVRGWMLW
jgi:hypothetical protein